MTDHKFTDEEVIKALELCFSEKGTTKTCRICPYHKLTLCKIYRDKDALYLIKRQKAEIERLRKYYFTHAYDECHNEAIKEFAERLKEKAYIPKPYGAAKVVDEYAVDDLVKEMIGETK